MAGFEEFEVVIYDNEPHLFEHDFKYAGLEIVAILEQTGFVGWLSPLHEPGTENKKEHFHCILKTDTRTPSLKSLRKKLSKTGLNFRGGQIPYIQTIRTNWANALLYLTHNTEKAKAEGKQQFDFDVRPLPINQPSSAYNAQICNSFYQETILKLITEFEISDCKALYGYCCRYAPQFANLVWRDASRWNNFLCLPKSVNNQ